MDSQFIDITEGVRKTYFDLNTFGVECTVRNIDIIAGDFIPTGRIWSFTTDYSHIQNSTPTTVVVVSPYNDLVWNGFEDTVNKARTTALSNHRAHVIQTRFELGLPLIDEVERYTRTDFDSLDGFPYPK